MRKIKLQEEPFTPSFGKETCFGFKSEKIIILVFTLFFADEHKGFRDSDVYDHGMNEFVVQMTSALYKSAWPSYRRNYREGNSGFFRNMSRGLALLWSVRFSCSCHIGIWLQEFYLVWISWFVFEKLADMLAEISRREKEANIKPNPALDNYLKVSWA